MGTRRRFFSECECEELSVSMTDQEWVWAGGVSMTKGFLALECEYDKPSVSATGWRECDSVVLGDSSFFLVVLADVEITDQIFPFWDPV